jgi:hypothetical protein
MQTGGGKLLVSKLVPYNSVVLSPQANYIE